APGPPEAAVRARAMARRFDWSLIVPRIRGVYDEALAESQYDRATTCRV
ncbi:MAG: hypothetical protein JWL71_3439, partial [Acidobacteria bacterium]|nr:hypothetical protein [Acidobacteriota bacterium]